MSNHEEKSKNRDRALFLAVLITMISIAMGIITDFWLGFLDLGDIFGEDKITLSEYLVFYSENAPFWLLFLLTIILSFVHFSHCYKEDNYIPSKKRETTALVLTIAMAVVVVIIGITHLQWGNFFFVGNCIPPALLLIELIHQERKVKKIKSETNQVE